MRKWEGRRAPVGRPQRGSAQVYPKPLAESLQRLGRRIEDGGAPFVPLRVRLGGCVHVDGRVAKEDVLERVRIRQVCMAVEPTLVQLDHRRLDQVMARPGPRHCIKALLCVRTPAKSDYTRLVAACLLGRTTVSAWHSTRQRSSAAIVSLGRAPLSTSSATSHANLSGERPGEGREQGSEEGRLSHVSLARHALPRNDA